MPRRRDERESAFIWVDNDSAIKIPVRLYCQEPLSRRRGGIMRPRHGLQKGRELSHHKESALAVSEIGTSSMSISGRCPGQGGQNRGQEAPCPGRALILREEAKAGVVK